MKKKLIIFVSVMFAFLVIAGVFLMYFKTTPEYAMIYMYLDYRANGSEVFENYLTENAKNYVTLVKSLSENELLNSFMKIFNEEESSFFKHLLENPQNIKWSFKGITSNGSNTSMTISFNIQNRITGKIDIILLKDNGKWMIDKFTNLNFDKFDIE